MVTDQELLQRAVSRWGSKQQVAKMLNIAPQTVSDWCKVRKKGEASYIVPIPKAHRSMLRLLLGVPSDDATPANPWQDTEWRRSCGVDKAKRQIERVYLKSGGRGREWETLMGVLDIASPWLEKDWRELYWALDQTEEGATKPEG